MKFFYRHWYLFYLDFYFSYAVIFLLISKLTVGMSEVTCCAVLSCSVVSDSLWPHGLLPTRLFCPWGFSRQEYWSGLPCPPPGESSQPRNQTQVSNPGLPHCRQILSCLSHQRRLREVINTDKVKFNCLLSCETHHDGELLKKHCRNNFYTIMYVKLILVEVPKLI